MGNHHCKKIAAVMLVAAIGIQPVYVQAKTREEIQQEREQKKSEQQGTQSQYKQSQSKVSSLEGQQDALEEEIQELDSQLVEVIASVSLMQDQISDTEKQIVKAQEDYDVAKAQEDAQYLAMKKRLRYLYEKGDTSYIEILSNASNWSGMLNQANYVEKLYEYDKQMLNRYILIKEEVAQKKNDLEDKKSDLETQKYELEEEQASMQQMIDEKKSQANDFDAQIAKAKQEAAAYKALIKQQNSELARLDEEENAIIKAEEERRKAEEAAKKAAEEKAKAEEKAAKSSNSGSSDSSSNRAGSSDSSSSSGSSSGGGLKTVPPASGSSGSDIAAYACQFVGNPYVAGGTSLTNGADCSGFVMSVYKNFGVSLPHSSTSDRYVGYNVGSLANAQPGDLVCYSGHVAIYIGGGQIVHASTEATGIKISNASYRTPVAIRRIF